MTAAEREFWLRGPVEGYTPLLQPVVHALLQARLEIRAAAAELTAAEVWARPAGVASVGFHLRHVAGVLDRLLTYARDEPLGPEQLAFLAAEAEPGSPPETAGSLLHSVDAAVERALEQLRHTPAPSLTDPRAVGRARLPSTVLGLLFHAAEHTQRHAGQLLVTARIVRSASAVPAMD